mgnify:CR=1 FL=1
MSEKLPGTKAHQKYYLKDGTIVPGVTTIVNLLNKPALIKWANNLGLEGIDTSKYVDKAAKIGTCAHYLIQCHLAGEEPDLSDYSAQEIDLAENALLKYWEWEKQFTIEPILLETSLVSEKMRYGGTIDCYTKLNGEYWLIDFKTGKALYDEMFIQVSAYRNLLLENDYKVEGVAILRIGRDETEGFEYRVIDKEDLERQWKIFQHLLAIYYLKKEGETKWK